MGMHVFRLPDVGEGIAEAEIVAWHVTVGESIKEDQPLVDVMTEKATVEIGAPVSGKVVERRGEAGDMVPALFEVQHGLIEPALGRVRRALGSDPQMTDGYHGSKRG